MSMLLNSPNFTAAWLTLSHWMQTHSHRVHTERWQGVDVKKDRSAETNELLNVSLSVPLQRLVSLDHWRQDIQPNLPWADKHFEERVSGTAMNPGTEWANWPWGKSASGFLEGGQFNHNYMERYWPKYAGRIPQPTANADEWSRAAHERDLWPNQGIREQVYGDLNDLVELLAHEPLTRQAYMPIFFPEDTGIGDGGRKPCTLGYHFIQRNNQLEVVYYMRSCDFAKHLRDDIYLTVRLLIWVLDECTKRNRFWRYVAPGRLTMHITSLHIFRNDYITLFCSEEAQQ